MRIGLSVLIVCLVTPSAFAHPVPKDTHDRTIQVRLQKGEKANEIKVRVEYRVEVDETTVWSRDMDPFRDVVNPLDFRGRPLAYYAEFAKLYGRIYADRLVVRVNKKEIDDFRVLSHAERLEDEDGKSLGHLRCDFVFESSFTLAAEESTKFRIREQNYLFDAGQVVMNLHDETQLPITSKTAPDEALRKRIADKKASAEDESHAREIIVVFASPARTVKAEPVVAAPTNVEPPAKIEPSPTAAPGIHQWFNLRKVFSGTNYGVFLTLVIAFVIGAAHALTPGHGKTLVAAYLVGERGTIWHACYLGLITTLTHTGAVIGIALLWVLLPEEHRHTFKYWIQNGLGLVMGLIVTCMGFALLLQRLAGRADHVHLGGGHHHHGDAPAGNSVTWRGLTFLGITGGMIPCWDAIMVLVASLGRGEFWFVLAAVLTFSAGLAVVLVAIGILVVQAPRYVESRFGSGRLLKLLPIASAIFVTLMGLWLCYEGVHSE
jgi:nickel/cobalt exporter